jgi:hypothetical protein
MHEYIELQKNLQKDCNIIPKIAPQPTLLSTVIHRCQSFQIIVHQRFQSASSVCEVEEEPEHTSPQSLERSKLSLPSIINATATLLLMLEWIARLGFSLDCDLGSGLIGRVSRSSVLVGS